MILAGAAFRCRRARPGVHCIIQVRESGMLVGMKNAVELVGDLNDYYDFAVNTECHEQDECGVRATGTP